MDVRIGESRQQIQTGAIDHDRVILRRRLVRRPATYNALSANDDCLM